MDTKEFFKNNKVQNTILILFMLFLLIAGSSMRLQNLPLLKDTTTGEYIPLALDPFYFMRLAETVQEDGSLPEFDTMRASGTNVPFVDEILPQAIFYIHKAVSVFDSSISLEFITIISPVIFFVLGILAFFFLILALTNSRLTAAVSSLLLTVIPPYLYRTLAGFADHEAIGMFAFFSAFLCYILALRFLRKDSGTIIKTILYGALVGLVSAFTILSWGGVANFIFLIIPLSFGVIWLMKSSKDNLLRYLIFYSSWFISSILFSVFLGYSFHSVITRFIISGSGILGPFLFMFLFIDYLFVKNSTQLIAGFRIIYSTIIVLIISSILLALSGRSMVPIIIEVFSRLLNPAGLSRIGNTVAENAAPYLTTLIAQIKNVFFYIFCVGCSLFGFILSKGIERNKERITFFLLWLFMLASIMFSRIASNSMLNGDTFVSKVFYFLGITLFAGYSFYLYFKDKLNIKEESIVIATWIFVSLVAVRGSIRFFFVVIPLFCFVSANLIPELFRYIRKSKDDLMKLFLWATLILVVLGLLASSINFWDASNQQAKYMSPSMNVQWQEAMNWTRANTQPEEIFVHWWDYGYWVQTLGERPTVTDGGHAHGYWDHLIARYLLTTPDSDTAFSFMKTHNVSYLLIDPSDIGKYPAYSKIGSGPDGEDRFSWIPSLVFNPSQTMEERDSVTTFYQGGSYVDQDIIYGDDFLPEGAAALGGVSLKINNNGSIENLTGIFIYNHEQYRIPIRYIFYENRVIDLGVGIDSLVNIIPSINQNTLGGIEVSRVGAMMYFSGKTFNTLFVQKYILNNINGDYENLKLVYSGKDTVINSINAQGAGVGEFAYFGGGIKGPIKIWEVSYPEDTEIREEFLSIDGEFAEYDR